MLVTRGTVRAPEIGRLWLNSPCLNLRQLRGRAVLVDFWDYTCLNCLRTLPYVQAWHDAYSHMGLSVIGVHTPEFTFAQYETNVERAIHRLGLTYPIVLDPAYELWKAFANRCWPSKYLLDKEGYLRFAHFGEGAYRDTELAIHQLLREIDPGIALPSPMPALRQEDQAGAACYPATPELYLGHKRGRIGNSGGFQEDSIAAYDFSGELEENCFYARGQWASTAEYFESAGDADHSLLLRYSAAGVNLVMAAPRGSPQEVIVRLDGKPLDRSGAASDISFELRHGREESLVLVDQARMYSLVAHDDFAAHRLELLCPAGVAFFAFTFTSCLDPVRTALLAGVEA